MIYLFSGDDAESKKKAYDTLRSSSSRGVEFLEISRKDFDAMHLENLYSGAGLFTQKFFVTFVGVLESTEIQEFILEKLSFLQDSGNIFVFLEGKHPKAVLDSFKKAKAEVKTFEKLKEKTDTFNNFLLAEAFAKRDKLGLWIYFRQAMSYDVGLDALAGVLFWKIKDMILKKNFTKFSEKELQNFASRISTLLSEARGKGKDPEISFEQFILEIT